eukprot:m51a1_g13551 putative serine-threonine protein (351) ;mRNA; r:112-1785
MSLVVEPIAGKIPPGHSLTINAKIEFHCTTKLRLRVPVHVSYLSSRKRAVRDYSFTLALESALSCRLDYDELEVSKVVGEGAFGIVYRGLWRGQEVAVKILKQQLPSEKEVTMMERLRNPFVVQLFGAVTTPGKLCIVTEFLPLGSVGQLIMKNRIAHVLKLMFLYEDLKPDNLMVVAVDINSPVHCKIADFSCTRDINAIGHKQFTMAVGTPLYMAPELLFVGDKGSYTSKADVFSYSIVMHEIITQRQAYSQVPEIRQVLDIVMYISAGKRLPVPPDFPQALAQLMTQCWDINPDRRPSFEAIAQALEPLESKAVAEHLARVAAHVARPPTLSPPAQQQQQAATTKNT